MWEQLEGYRNHFLQKEIKDVMKPSSINCLQTKGKEGSPLVCAQPEHKVSVLIDSNESELEPTRLLQQISTALPR